MGSEKTQSGTTQSTQTVQPAPYEAERNKLSFEREQAINPALTQMQQGSLGLVNDVIGGKMNLMDWVKQAGLGIGEDTITSMVNKSLGDVNNQLQKSGAGTYMESGASQAAGVQTAADLRNQASQFNIGSGFNLLNQILTGQSQVQQPIIGFTNDFSGRLAGLRSSTSSGTYNQSTYGTNPFLRAGATAGGAALGSFGGPTGALYGGAIGGSLFQ